MPLVFVEKQEIDCYDGIVLSAMIRTMKAAGWQYESLAYGGRLPKFKITFWLPDYSQLPALQSAVQEALPENFPVMFSISPNADQKIPSLAARI